MANKLGKLMTCHERLQPLMLLQIFIIWSSEITSQTKIIIYPLPEHFWLQKQAEW